MPSSVLQNVSMQYLDLFRETLAFEQGPSGWTTHRDPLSSRDIHRLHNHLFDLFRASRDDMCHRLSTDGQRDFIQGNGFGLIEDFDFFINTGLLYSHRIVLWDYAWGRILPGLAEDPGGWPHLCEVISNLLNIQDLFASGAVCLLPHPLSWNRAARNAVNDLSEKPEHYTHANFGLVSSLSVCTELNIHPYTLCEGSTSLMNISGNYNNLITPSKIDFMYNITEMVDNHPFSVIQQISPSVFHEFLQKNNGFFNVFRETFIQQQDNLSNAERYEAFKQQKAKLIDAFQAREHALRAADRKQELLKRVLLAGLLSVICSGDPGTVLSGIALFSTSLAAHLAEEKKQTEGNTLILGFSKLQNIANP